MDKNCYCRFCAEPKSKEKLIYFDSDHQKYDEILQKLTALKLFSIDISIPDTTLPRTMCFLCYDSLSNACEFVKKVADAQAILSDIFLVNESLSDDDRAVLDEFLSNDNIENSPEIKQESNSPEKPCFFMNTETTESCKIEPQVNVKTEPKEELTELEDVINRIQNPTANFDNLNVQDILDSSVVTLYAKDLAELTQKNVESWKDYPWICTYCNIEFLDLETLRTHAKMVHGKCSAFMCIDCKKCDCSNDFLLFIEHVKSHRETLRLHCHYCDTSVPTTEELTTHIKQHFLKSQLPCPTCGEILKNEDVLNKHLLQYNTTKRKRRPRRKRGTPVTIEDLTCKECQKVYKTLNSLRDHMKLHTNDRKRNHTCDRCGKTFFNKGTLTSHIMSHDEIRPYLCKICNKSFLFPNMLRRHVLMHSGEKPFACDQCGRCFRLSYQLKAHQIVHTDSMPHVCQYCSKAFRFKQILKNHERQHTGAKPYNCQFCGMEFTNWSNYNKHMKRRHGVDTSKKKITPEGVFPINPETGQIMTVDDPIGTEIWKNKIMTPGKRGKKKVIKEENLDS